MIPVLWYHPSSGRIRFDPTPNWVPLYVKYEMKGLTEQERCQIAIDCGCASADWMQFAAAIETKIKEKNFG